jgi:hypothetical protein
MSAQRATPSDPRYVNPTVYKPDPSPTAWNLWYADADFEDGSMLIIAYYFGLMRPPGDANQRFVEFSLYEPDGSSRRLRVRFSKEECRASQQRCDIVMGHNSYRYDDDGKCHIKFSDRGLGCDLVFDPVVTGHQPDLSVLPGVSKTYVWYIASPRARVSGTVTASGKTVDVAGDGYLDLSWDRVPIGIPGAGDIFWGKILQGDWTIIWQTGTLFVGKGTKIILESTKGVTEASDPTTRETPIERPERILFRINDPGVAEGELRFRVVKTFEFIDLLRRFKPFQKWFIGAYSGKPAYFRYRLEHEVNLEILGEKVTGKGASWCEHHKIP